MWKAEPKKVGVFEFDGYKGPSVFLGVAMDEDALIREVMK